MNAARLLELYERVAEAPDAIARLRRFVLDLAVRGKLVEQDAAEEPASAAVQRLAAARARVPQSPRDAAGRRVDRSVSKLAFDLPAQWQQLPLSAITRVLNGRAYKRSELLDQGPTKVLRVGNLFTSDHWYFSDLDLEDDKYCAAGDLIYAWSASFGPFVWEGPRVIYHYHIWKLDLFSRTDFDQRYLYIYLLQKTREIKESGHGISMVHMTKEKMEQLAVPVPPLAEQHRIVAKFDQLMALLDRLEAARSAREATRDRLGTASLARLTAPDTDAQTLATHARFALDALPALTTRTDQIKQLRQTILNLAVLGNLVGQDPADEPASRQLSRLRAARQAAHAAEQLRERKPVTPPSQEDFGFDLPGAWELTYFDEVFVLVSGVAKGGKLSPGGAVELPYLRVANVQRGHLDLAVIKTIWVSSSDRERYLLKSGDILMTEGGDWDKLGRAAIWRGEVAHCIHQNHVFRVRPPTGDIASEWVVIYVNSQLGRRYFEDAAKQTTNLASINMTQLRACPLPLPPLAEQHRIVAKVDELMVLCDRLEAALARADSTRARLLDALLTEALAGPSGSDAVDGESGSFAVHRARQPRHAHTEA